MATVTLREGSRNLPKQLTINDKAVNQVGKSRVFFTTDDQYVVTIYHRPTPDKDKLLQHFLDLGRNFGEDEKFLLWPLGIVERLDGRASVGVVTRRVPSTYMPLDKLISSPIDAVTRFKQGQNWLEHIKMAHGIAIALRTIHSKGMAHADIHFKNFLANPISGEVVLMIDLDGLVIKGFLPPQVMGMPGFIAPEVVMGQEKPSQLTDRHSSAVLILWTLLMRNVMQTQRCYDDEEPMRDDQLGYGKFACFSEHPNDRRNWIPRTGTPLFRNGVLSYRALTPKLQQLTERALIHGLHTPSKRPQLVEWERALAEVYDVIVSCQSCRQSFCYPYWLQPPRRQCPFCGTGIRPPYPVIGQLMEVRAKGVHVPVREAIFYHGWPLFADLITPCRVPPLTRRGVPILGQTVWVPKENVHRLVNRGNTSWQVVRGNKGQIKPGQSVVLQHGLVLRFGDKMRLMRVVE